MDFTAHFQFPPQTSLFLVCFTHLKIWLMSLPLSWNVRHAETSNTTMSLLPKMKRTCFAAAATLLIVSFASLNLPLEALDSLLTLQPSAAEAQLGNLSCNCFEKHGRLRYVPSCFVWMETFPWILINPVTFMSLYWLLQSLSCFLVKWMQFYEDSDFHREGGKNHMNINLTNSDKRVPESIPHMHKEYVIWITNEKIRLGFFLFVWKNQNRDTFSCSSGIPN